MLKKLAVFFYIKYDYEIFGTVNAHETASSQHGQYKLNKIFEICNISGQQWCFTIQLL